MVAAFCVWALPCGFLIGQQIVAAHGHWLGGRAFGAELLAFAVLFAGTVLFAARGVLERFASFGPGAGWLCAALLLIAYVLYTVGTGYASGLRLLAIGAFLFLPLLLLAGAGGAPPGSWQDFAVILLIWTAVKFGPTHWLWPYPGGRLAYILSVLLAVNAAIAGFLLLRRTQGAGYSIGWGPGWTFAVLGSLFAFACVAIPLGLKLHFIAYAPRYGEWLNFLPLAIGIIFFTAWPEEFLFRGLLQNLLSRRLSPTIGWILASLLFGLSHIANVGFPNWRYVLLAAIAGLFYGWTWRRTGSIFASALVHGAVDVLWHFLFSAPAAQ